MNRWSIYFILSMLVYQVHHEDWFTEIYQPINSCIKYQSNTDISFGFWVIENVFVNPNEQSLWPNETCFLFPLVVCQQLIRAAWQYYDRPCIKAVPWASVPLTWSGSIASYPPLCKPCGDVLSWWWSNRMLWSKSIHKWWQVHPWRVWN